MDEMSKSRSVVEQAQDREWNRMNRERVDEDLSDLDGMVGNEYVTSAWWPHI